MKKRLLTYGLPLLRYGIMMLFLFFLSAILGGEAEALAGEYPVGGFMKAGASTTISQVVALVIGIFAMNSFLRVFARYDTCAYAAAAGAFLQEGARVRYHRAVLRSYDFWAGNLLCLFFLLFASPFAVAPNAAWLIVNYVSNKVILVRLIIGVVYFALFFLLNLISHTDARLLWRSGFMKGGTAPETLKQVKRRLLINLIIRCPATLLFYTFVLTASPFLVSFFASLLWIVVQAKLYIFIPVVLLLLLLYRHFRAWRRRLAFLERLEQVCLENKYTLRCDRCVRRFFLGGRGQFRIRVETGKCTYSCMLIDCSSSRSRVVFGRGEYTIVHRVGILRYTLFHFQSGYRFDTEGVENPCIVCLPLLKTTYIADEAGVRLLHSADHIWNYTVHDDTSFLSQIRWK